MPEIREPLTLLTIGLATGVLTAVASFAFRREWRGRRTGEVPHCAKCDFDLSGLPPEQKRCPECGTDLDARPPRKGERRPRPTAMAVWGVIAVASIAVATVSVRAGASRYDWIRLKPVSLLARDLTTLPVGNPGARLAEDELYRRLRAGRLSDADKRKLALVLPVAVPPSPRPVLPAGVVYLGRPLASYYPSISIDCAADLRRRGALGDADWAIVCEHLIGCSLRIRNPVPRGAPIPIDIFADCAETPRAMTRSAFRAVTARLDGEPVAGIGQIRGGMVNLPDHGAAGSGNGSGAVQLTAEQWRRVSNGSHALAVTLEIEVTIGTNASGGALEYHGQIVLNARVRVVGGVDTAGTGNGEGDGSSRTP